MLETAKSLVRRALQLSGLYDYVRPTPAAEWRQILRRSKQILAGLPESPKGPVVAILTTMGQMKYVGFDSILAYALRLRGARPMLVLCDGFLPACDSVVINQYTDANDFVSHGPVKCHQCFPFGHAVYSTLRLPYYRLSQLVSPAHRQEVLAVADQVGANEWQDYHYEGVNLGEHIHASVLRFTLSGQPGSSPAIEGVARRFLQAALLQVEMAKAIAAMGTEILVAQHGLYVTQGVPLSYLRTQGVRIVTWEHLYRKSRVLLTHGDTYHKVFESDVDSDWQQMHWSPERDRELVGYLESRRTGSQDLLTYHPNPIEDPGQIIRQLRLDTAKPIVGMFPNLLWDGQIRHPESVFSGTLDWVLSTIECFVSRPDLQLVVRAHPAEVKHANPARQRVTDEIRRRFPTLPAHIHLVEPEDDISSYTLGEMINAAIVYGTKLGLELAARGKPVIVGGAAWYRGCGFTYDAHTRADYWGLLGRLPDIPPLTEEQTLLARKYAYHLLFRRLIPVKRGLRTDKRWGAPGHALTTLSQLLPGQDRYLDVICEGILQGTPFVAD